MDRCLKDEPTTENLVCKKALPIPEKKWKNLLGVTPSPPPPGNRRAKEGSFEFHTNLLTVINVLFSTWLFKISNTNCCHFYFLSLTYLKSKSTFDRVVSQEILGLSQGWFTKSNFFYGIFPLTEMLIRVNNFFEFEQKSDPKIGSCEPASRELSKFTKVAWS